jgi:hypothetical protein
MGQMQLILLVATLLAGVAVAWLVHRGLWREKRLWPIAILLLGGYALLARRLGWGELLVLAGVVLVPLLLVPARRAKR